MERKGGEEGKLPGNGEGIPGKSIRRTLARLLEFYDMQRREVSEAYQTNYEVVAILMNDEEANAIRDWLVAGV